MNLYIKNGNVFINNKFQKTNITIQNGLITSLSDGENRNRLSELDAESKYVVPGFIDIHTHGGNGVDVNNSTVQGLGEISSFFATQGTTSWLASIVTDTEERTLTCINNIVEAIEKPVTGARLLGIHLEGPFLSFDYRGSMAKDLLKNTDPALFNKYYKAACGRIMYITIAPELEGMLEFVEEIRFFRIVVAIGHSGADYDTAMDCIKSGAMSTTHTFNGMKLMHQHFPAISGAVLESDIYCEAICDGRHLHPGTVRFLLKTKGFDRVVAVTDSIMATGLKDGYYKIGVNDIVVKDGDAKLVSDGMRAGSTLTMITALKNLIDFTGKKLEELIPLLTINPATLLKIDDHKGSVEIGKDADLVLLDNELSVNATIVGGNVVHKAPGI